MARRTLVVSSYKRLSASLVVAVILLATTLTALGASGSQLRDRSLTLADSRAGQSSVTYKFGYTVPSLDPIQTVVFEFCSNNPFPNTPCTAPAGMDASAAVLANETGDIGFNVAPSSDANHVILTRPPFASNGTASTYTLTGIKNPAAQGSYYVRVQTFPDSNTTGDGNFYGGIAYVLNASVSITATVPPYLLFCVGVTVVGTNCDNVQGDSIDFGEFSSRQASQGSTQMLAATNALNGYTIYANGTTLTSGTNTISALTSNDVSRPGVSQFGMNLRANGAPAGGTAVSGPGSGQPMANYNQANFYRFNDGEAVATSLAPDDARKYTTTYVVNIQKNQAPGVYASTLTYIALGSF